MLRLTGLAFAWPDGTTVFDGLDLTLSGRSGLTGVNGSGKSTLLRLAAGELTPSRGTVLASGEIGYLPQNLPLGVARTVADLLGVATARDALRAIEAGDLAPEHYDNVVWDVEERAYAELTRLGLGHLSLDRTVATLSGGETMLTGLAARLLRAPAVLLLDEPTNNLDLRAREHLYERVLTWPGTLVVVSHDRVLLEMVDEIAELPSGRVFGGTFSEYEEALAAERETAERLLRSAETDLRRERRQLSDAHVKLARRQRYARKMWENKREPKIVMGARKRAAQVSAGKHRITHEQKEAQARDRVRTAEEAAETAAEIRIELPDTSVPGARLIASIEMTPDTEVTEAEVSEALAPAPVRPRPIAELRIYGPERIALLGVNGSGKTTLLRRLAAAASEPDDRTGTAERVAYLPQRLDVLDEEESLVANVRAMAPEVSVNEARAMLARFLFRGGRAEQPAAVLSGGERFRVVLAGLLLTRPRLLLLDEPTNNLDLASVRQLAQALSAYKGALVVASHDLPFLDALGITRRIDITRQNRKKLEL